MLSRIAFGTYYEPKNIESNLFKDKGVSNEFKTRHLKDIRYQQYYESPITTGLEKYLNSTNNNKKSINSRLANYTEYMFKLYKKSLCDLVAIRNKVNILKWAIDNNFIYGWSTVEASIKGKSIECLKLVLSIMKKKSIKILKKYLIEDRVPKNGWKFNNYEHFRINYLTRQKFFFIPKKRIYYGAKMNEKEEMSKEMSKEKEKAYYNNLIDDNIPVNNQLEFKKIIKFYIDQRYDIEILNRSLDEKLNKLSEYSE
jgi:hypothetical protein